MLLFVEETCFFSQIFSFQFLGFFILTGLKHIQRKISEKKISNNKQFLSTKDRRFLFYFYTTYILFSFFFLFYLFQWLFFSFFYIIFLFYYSLLRQKDHEAFFEVERNNIIKIIYKKNLFSDNIKLVKFFLLAFFAVKVGFSILFSSHFYSTLQNIKKEFLKFKSLLTYFILLIIFCF